MTDQERIITLEKRVDQLLHAVLMLLADAPHMSPATRTTLYGLKKLQETSHD